MDTALSSRAYIPEERAVSIPSRSEANIPEVVNWRSAHLPHRACQDGFGFHASHTSVMANRVIISGNVGLKSALAKHR